MKTFIKIAAASAIALSAAAAPALAKSTALDTTTYWEQNAKEVQPGVYKLMYDADNKAMRSDDDFAAMWGAGPGQMPAAPDFDTCLAEAERIADMARAGSDPRRDAD